jgi:hypothetical protein
MPGVYIYECVACDARFSMIMPDPPPHEQWPWVRVNPLGIIL